MRKYIYYLVSLNFNFSTTSKIICSVNSVCVYLNVTCRSGPMIVPGLFDQVGEPSYLQEWTNDCSWFVWSGRGTQLPAGVDQWLFLVCLIRSGNPATCRSGPMIVPGLFDQVGEPSYVQERTNDCSWFVWAGRGTQLRAGADQWLFLVCLIRSGNPATCRSGPMIVPGLFDQVGEPSYLQERTNDCSWFVWSGRGTQLHVGADQWLFLVCLSRSGNPATCRSGPMIVPGLFDQVGEPSYVQEWTSDCSWFVWSGRGTQLRAGADQWLFLVCLIRSGNPATCRSGPMIVPGLFEQVGEPSYVQERTKRMASSCSSFMRTPPCLQTLMPKLNNFCLSLEILGEPSNLLWMSFRTPI